MESQPTLYGYWRSSASWRVRWALELLQVEYIYVPVNLLNGENKEAAHLARHPLGFVPVLEWQGQRLSESLAIFDWLANHFPAKSSLLFGSDPWQRAKIIELCEVINSGTAPMQTPRVQKRHSKDVVEQNLWAKEFIEQGLKAFQALRPLASAPFSVGNELSAADLFLVPQIYNALRYQVAVAAEFPQLFAIYEKCLRLEACSKASPERQVDCPPPST